MLNNSYQTLNALPPITLVYGEDYYLISETIEGLTSLLPSGINDIDYLRAGDGDSLKDFLFDCFNLPFMSDKRLAIVKRASNLSSEEKFSFDNYIKAPSETTALIIADTSGVFKDFIKKIAIIKCDRPSMGDAVERAMNIAVSKGAIMERSAAGLLAEYTDRYMSAISIEIEKLSAYVGVGGTITANDVKECVTPEADYQIYQFINALTGGDALKAVTVSETLLRSGKPPIVLLSSLIGQFRKLLHISLIGNIKTDKEYADMFGSPLFAISRDRMAASKYTQKALKAALDKLYDYEFSFKSGRMTEDQALKSAIAYLLVGDKKNG